MNKSHYAFKRADLLFSQRRRGILALEHCHDIEGGDEF